MPHLLRLLIAIHILLYYSINAVNGGALSKTVLYQAPDECRWSGSSDSDITLICHLRTINSELENTNFSVIQPQNTIRLRLECNDALFFQSSLSADSFRSLIELRSLTIEYCKLGNLTEGSFRGLQDLRNLTIRTHNGDWSTMSLDIAPGSFSEFRQLDYLDLSLNNIWLIPENMICPLKVLKHLNISNNEIQDIGNFQFSAALRGDSGSNSGSSLRKSRKICGSSLIDIDLSHNKIANLPPTIFSSLSHLRKLNLARNSMNYIADRALEGLVSLHQLDLSENRLTSLPPELFSDTKLLKEIFLRNNSINVLAPGLFTDLHELIVLDLSANELNSQWVNSATFVGLKQLQLLDLSSNKINKLEIHIFRSLNSLQVLKLDENYIDHITENVFIDLNNLHTLILSNNRIATIEAQTFYGLFNIMVLSLDYNRITNIHVKAFENCTKLQDLHLNSNKLKIVPNALAFILQLKTLDMGENLISNIENTSISRMENLYGLRLTENMIRHVKRGVFDSMTSLHILNLSGNKIENIDAGALQRNTQLQAVRLDCNYLKSIAGLFTELPNLVWLNISDNRLEKFDYSHIPPGLQWLDVRSNRITHLGNYFEIENELSLTTFDASSNLLSEIIAGSIPNSIEILYLNDNLISKIQPYTFFKKPNLTMVDLIRNKLTTLEPNALRLSPIPEEHTIPEFFIGYNPFHCDCNLDWIQKLNSDSRTQPKLMDLHHIYCDLSYARGRTHVPLIEAKSNEFLCKYETHCFALCHCCDFYACDCKMECPDKCSCYHDQSWTSNVVDCSRSGYERDLPTHIPMDSSQLYLDGNNFKELPSHAFIGRKRLKILYLNNSHIELIHNRTFYGLVELEILQLNHNNLQQLHGNEFQGLENLHELYLQHNLITNVDALAFTHLYRLKILRLDHNRIVELALWNLLPPYIKELRLGSNPWSCNCNFIDKFRDYINLHDSVQDKQQLKCSSLAGSNGAIDVNVTTSTAGAIEEQSIEQYNLYVMHREQLANKANNIQLLTCGNLLQEHLLILEGSKTMPKDHLNPLNSNSNLTSKKTILTQQLTHDYVPILVTILTGFIFIIICIFLVFIFRQEMRVWCHSRFGIRLFYNSSKYADKHEREKLFDAFVSYSIKDEAFVIEELAPLLEQKEMRYKLCLQTRDFPVGGYITDTIVQAIDTSRRTIMVVSENFIKTEWCRFEFKSAHQSVLRDRRKRLIVIVLGDVPQKDLDPELRLYLKTNDYLQWGDKFFLEKLRFALPDVPHNCSSANNSGAQRNRLTNGNNHCANVSLQVVPVGPASTTNHHHHMHHGTVHSVQHINSQIQLTHQQQQQQQQQLHHIQHSSFRSQNHHNIKGSRQNHNRNTATCAPAGIAGTTAQESNVLINATCPNANMSAMQATIPSTQSNIQHQSLPLPPPCTPSPRCPQTQQSCAGVVNVGLGLGIGSIGPSQSTPTTTSSSSNSSRTTSVHI